ncbi:prophage protein [Escherichia coli]|nr:prophage protein [Escherichia coli]
MAKNFVEEGKTVAIVASAAISSGDLVQVGDVFAVALTDIPQGETGDGMTEGVAGKTQCLIPFPGWQRVWMRSRSERWERQPRLMMSI